MNASSRLSKRNIIFREASLPLSFAIIILLGLLLVVLGILLFPVNLGLLPFSPDGQLGLLLVLNALQMMALGNTPLGQFKRSWIMVLIGIGFASMGIISCIVPGILTFIIQYLLGLLNIGGGVIFLATGFLPTYRAIQNPPPELISSVPVYKKMLTTQTVLNIVSIMFGITMLLPGLVSGFIISGIVIINGILLFMLVRILQRVS
ncbi:hypothetical protein ACKUB1_09115 [Methanospirillum stamsii]|uniref:hypothetical protein n=1 Tax=Methanospirillum stamsii TaxID=1277351 RepID=UPI001FE6B420|nr:hypothetical protein [Methanospirillum stamsii]